MKTINYGWTAIVLAAAVSAGCSKQDTESNSQASIPPPSDESVQISSVDPLDSGILLTNMDLNIRPQDDFYAYVNGKWLADTEIPADKARISVFSDLADKSDEDVKAIIEELAQKSELQHGSDEQKVADLFRSYMNAEHLETLGLSPLKTDFARIEQISNTDELLDHMIWSQNNGGGSPIIFYVGIDAKDSTRYAAHIYQGGIHLPDRDYYLEDTERFTNIRAAYLKHIETMFELAGLSNGKQAPKVILELETAIAKAHRTRVENRDSEKRYNKYLVSDLPKLTDKINWSHLLKAIKFSDQTELIINQPDFVQAFGELIESASLDDWKIYMTWQILNGSANFLTAALDEADFNFYGTVLNGQEEQLPRWKRGVNTVNRNLGEIIGKVYVSRHFKPEAKVRMLQLVENLRSAYGDSIDGLTWMSDETKKAAHRKLAAFTPKIGYPDRWEDYSKLDIQADDLLGNIRRSLLDNAEKDLERLHGPIRKWEWGMTPQTVNAYYSPTRNEIVFPAAILQAPFFNMDADDAVNYGGIGAVIGHEMGHGFDDQGSRYDGDGNLNNWWTESDLAAFKKLSSKLVDQYAAYQVFDDLNVNGELTLGENIGDLSGLTVAYRAYKMSQKNAEVLTIDGFTGDQRFFLGFGQIWRSKDREKALRNRVATNPHSPGNFRALGALSNMSEFNAQYAVKDGDKMYIPEENRIKIW